MIAYMSMLYSSRHLITGMVIVFLLLSSCHSTGPPFQRIVIDSSSNPLLYIYRAASDCMGSTEIAFLVDDAQVITVRGGEYGYTHVYPGKSLIVSDTVEKKGIPSLKIMINTEKGKEYFVAYEITCESTYVVLHDQFNLRMKLKETSEGRSQIADTTLTPVPNQQVEERR